MAGLGDGDDVFMTHAAEAGDVDTGLDRDDLAGVKGGGGDARGFVDLQAQAVAEAVEEPAPPALALFGGIALLGEKFADTVLDGLAWLAGLDGPA